MNPTDLRREINLAQLNGLHGLAKVLLQWYGEEFPDEPQPPFKWNPAHPVGTCAKCGDEMVYNVPRMGAAGGFVHKETCRLDCAPHHNTQRERQRSKDSHDPFARQGGES